MNGAKRLAGRKIVLNQIDRVGGDDSHDLARFERGGGGSNRLAKLRVVRLAIVRNEMTERECDCEHERAQANQIAGQFEYPQRDQDEKRDEGRQRVTLDEYRRN